MATDDGLLVARGIVFGGGWVVLVVGCWVVIGGAVVVGLAVVGWKVVVFISSSLMICFLE